MLRLRALGQYAPPAPYGAAPYGYAQPSIFGAPVVPYHPIDPTVYYALRTAGAALSASGDPGAQDTVELIRRNIEAQGFPWEWATSGVTQGTPGRVSNVNSTLSLLATMRENPIVSTAGLVLIPVLAYMLGKKSAKRG